MLFSSVLVEGDYSIEVLDAYIYIYLYDFLCFKSCSVLVFIHCTYTKVFQSQIYLGVHTLKFCGIFVVRQVLKRFVDSGMRRQWP
jgi:hypothetical protein